MNDSLTKIDLNKKVKSIHQIFKYQDWLQKNKNLTNGKQKQT